MVERDDVDGDITSEWAEEFFARRDPRDLIEVVIETGAGDREIEALSGLFDDLGVPALVTAGYRRSWLCSPRQWRPRPDQTLGMRCG